MALLLAQFVHQTKYMQTRKILVFLAVLVSMFAFACSRAKSQFLAITHVTVIDATGSPAQRDMTVLIAKQHIAAIGPSASTNVPSNFEILDASGKFLIPGLTDAHIHLTGAGEPSGSREFIVPLLLANGITTVRDMGGYLESIFPLREEIKNGKRLGPQIFTPGPYLDGSPPSFQPSFVVTNATQASEDVGNLVQRHVDFIKVQSRLNRDAYFAIAAAAKREHISFVGHVPDQVSAIEASNAGQRSIEHLTGELRACAANEPGLMRQQMLPAAKNETLAQAHARQFAWERELLASYSEAKAEQLIATFLYNDTWQTPTLILLKSNAYPISVQESLRDPRNKYVPRKILDSWREGTHDRDKFVSPQEYEFNAKLLEKSMQFVGKMQSAGIHIMAGTDSSAPYDFPGFSLHEELVLLVESGLTPMQALQAATKNPAEFLGVFKTQGSIEQGKVADLLLLDANPLDDIHNTQKIRALILQGKLLDRSTLDQLLSTEQSFSSK